MACFVACVAQALICHGIKKSVEHHEKVNSKAPVLSKKLSLLVKMLLSGSFLLMIEHIFHGEIVPFYPFLTAMNDPEDTREMLYEILTLGGSMDVAITAVWALYCYVSDAVSGKKEVKA